MLHLHDIEGTGQKRIGKTDEGAQYVTFSLPEGSEGWTCANCARSILAGWMALQNDEAYCDDCVVDYV